MKLKKEIKYVALAYVIVAILTYVATLRFDRLSKNENYNKESRTIVLKLK